MSDFNNLNPVEPSYSTRGPDQPTNTMAVISLISGIVGLTILPIVGSIIALILGYMARKEIRESGGSQGGDGFATAGLVMGWIGVGLALCACLAFVAFFVFTFAITGVAIWEMGSLLTFVLI
jgi:hypothetical protein